MTSMHINYSIYQQKNVDAFSIYQKWRELEKALFLQSRYFDYTYLIPAEKAKFPNEIQTKKISQKKLEEGLQCNAISSFSMRNELSFNSPVLHLLSVQGDKEFGKIASVDFHLPECCVREKFAWQAFDEFIFYLRPTYGFFYESQCYDVMLNYHYRQDFRVSNERDDFVGYMKVNDSIQKMRMLYSVNYLTQMQLDYAVNGVSLREFISTLGEGKLQAMGNELFKLCIEEEKLDELNDFFGKAGFLVGWWDYNQYKKQRDEARKRRRDWFRSH